jgi:hypothetical protein
MRKVCLFAALAILLTIPAVSSAQESYLELLRSDVRAEKVALITELMMFTDEQAEVFWPIYRDMEHEVGKLGDRRIAIIKEYAEHYEQMTDEKAKELISKTFALREDFLALEKKYHKKLAKALDPITAAKFYQVNRGIDQMIDIQISSGLPFFK